MPDGLGEYLLVRSNADTDGAFVEMEWVLPPGAFAPPPHRHPTQVEEYEILEGRLEIAIDGQWREFGPGESAAVPVNADHTFRVIGEQPVRVHNFHRPGSHFDEFIEKQYRFAKSPRFKGLKRPSTAIVMAIVWREHADLLVPSNRVLGWAMAALAQVGRWLGYRTD